MAVNPLTGEGSRCDAADRCVHDQACPFVAGCSKVDGRLTAVVETVDGTPLTVVQEWELYVTRGVVPSAHAISHGLGEDRDDVLRMLDARRGAEARA